MRRSARGVVVAAASMALVGLLLAAFGAGSASAIGIAKWEAGTCTVSDCTYGSNPEAFYPQAAGHPPFAGTDFTVEPASAAPADQDKRVKVELPVGLNVNPQATPQCPIAVFENGAQCDPATQVGVSEVTSEPEVEVLPGLPLKVIKVGPLPFAVYNLVPEAGEPARFGFHVTTPVLPVVSEYITLRTSIDWAGDYHESFYIDGIDSFPPLKRDRLVFNGQAGGSFVTLPSPCNGPTTSLLELESQAGATATELTTPPVPIVGCQSVPFAPTVTASADGPTDSSTPISVALNVPQHNAPELNSSTVRSANITLPAGTGLNPATAPGLKFCPDDAFPMHSEAPVTCPAESQIGTVAVEAPALPPGSLTGPIYLAEQKSRDPESGDEYRIFFDAASTRYDVQVREEGKVKVDAKTGQITGEFTELPQVGFSSATLNFGQLPGHSIPVLSSPPLCSNTSTSSAVPWSTGAVTSTGTTEIKLDQAPGGGSCANTLGERPFSPGFLAVPGTSKVATYTPYQLNITRGEGQQEIKGFNVTLPPGATAKLAGIPYCQPGEYQAAIGKSGAEEQKSSSCKAESQIGSATILSGTGSTPLQIEGKVYLSGPYKGAPLSAVVITPAVAGPFDLGNVVVTAPLDINPETAQVSTSAEIPNVFGGAKLDIRSIQVNLNRNEFTLNGTNCKPSSVTGTVQGGGSDPTNSGAWSSFKVSTPARGDSCKALKFKPKLNIRLFGQTGRAKHPKLVATLSPTAGEANIFNASVALPHAIFLDQASLGTVCTRPQFAAEQCPAKSVYGKAVAYSPLLGQPLEGQVVLRSSNNKLPDLVTRLKGQVTIDLAAKIDSFKGGIRTTFANIPDLPVSKFVLTLPGGKHGLLLNSTSLCAKPVKGIVRLTGHNSRRSNTRPTIKTQCKKKKKKGHKKGKHKGSKHSKKHKGSGNKKKGGKNPAKNKGDKGRKGK